MKLKIPMATAFSLLSLCAYPVTEEEALGFLYSSMSLADRADYPEEFYVRNIRASLKAREEMPWGSSVPDREFLHFVLPVRVNNENLDDSRIVFYEELRDRVKGLGMEEAVLEVNHWCHEKVTYKPSDARTSSPLSSVSQAIGRCGEESTFTVAALRAVGIPARQIYTPRWAHTDDNHAWVEAWADGKWHFLGACEPEPVLDLAWFNDPASRGLLMSTNVAGDYHGEEEVLLRQPLTTRINVTSNYAPVATLPVRVVTADGMPAEGATVNFCIYNYAEYYPAVTKIADSRGEASLTTGLGDMIVWATDGSRFGIAKGNAGDYTCGKAPLEIVLDRDNTYEGVIEYDIIPPAAGSGTPRVGDAERALNNRRLQEEDSIRGSYMATFSTPEIAREEALRLGVDVSALTKVLLESRGNHRAIVKCLWNIDPTKRGTALDLLMNVTEKDRRDIPADVIIDNAENTVACDMADRDFFNRYVLSPRIETEGLRPWRKLLSEAFSSHAGEFRKDPARLAAWVADSICADDSVNPSMFRMSPGAVLRERRADRISRNIFFVAVARSLGIPARIDPVTGTTQYSLADGGWTDADFGGSGNDEEEESPKGYLRFSYVPDSHMTDPRYYSQFSVSVIKDGVPRLLEFDENATLQDIFGEPYALAEGQYVVTTGRRLANGGVRARSEFFHVGRGETTEKELKIRDGGGQLSVIGSLNAENIYHDLDSGNDRSLISTTGRGYYVVGLVSPNQEPTTHALNDIAAYARQLEDTGVKMVLLFDDDAEASRFDATHFPDLPGNVVFGIDRDGATRADITGSLNLGDAVYPVFVVADTFNRIVWVSSGYVIGLGDILLDTLSTVK